MSWRTQGKGPEHKHYPMQSNKGDSKMPPLSSYKIEDFIDMCDGKRDLQRISEMPDSALGSIGHEVQKFIDRRCKGCKFSGPCKVRKEVIELSKAAKEAAKEAGKS